jgi:cation-transporting ATPase 13A1
MTAMGLLGTISFMSVSRSKPLDKLSRVRPLTSIFHPALFVSLLGQFCIHLFTMVLAVRTAKQHLPPDYEVELDGVFKPGILNTVVFLVANVQQVTVFVVNLQGRPFMTGLTENRPLLWSLLATFILTFMFASETVPGLNKYFQLVPFPDDAFRDFILRILLIDVVGSFMLDRFMKFIFCPKILFASIEGTTLNDVMMLGRTVAVLGFVMYVFLGNDETWEALLQEEARLLAELETNETVSNSTAEIIAETAKACVGAACDAASAAVLGGNDEF